MDADWLETIVKRKTYEDSPIKVLEFRKADPGIGKGENYLSRIERVTAQVLFGSGLVRKMSFIVKNMLEAEAMRKFCQDNGVFFKEITMYRDIFPKMCSILESVGDPEIFWPKCYDVRLYDRLVFEDLGELGFRMANRKKQLGLEASLLVIRQLAKFHALSKMLLERGEIPTQVFAKPSWLDSHIKNMDATLRRFISAMADWGDDWKEAIERFTKAEDFIERYSNSLNVEQSDFVVLTHGDCWTNNMLFSGNDMEHPTAVRFIDFQVGFITSPIRDITYFLSTSVRHDVISESVDVILETYADTLGSYLSRLGCQGFIPDREYVRQELKKREILLLSDAIRVLPWQLTNKENVPNVEEINKKVNQLKLENKETDKDLEDMMNIFKNLDPTAENIMKDLVKRALDQNII